MHALSEHSIKQWSTRGTHKTVHLHCV